MTEAWWRTDFSSHQRKLAAGQGDPGLERAPHTHQHSVRLKTFGSLKALLKGLRDDKGSTHDASRSCVACELYRTVISVT